MPSMNSCWDCLEADGVSLSGEQKVALAYNVAAMQMFGDARLNPDSLTCRSV